MQVISASKPLTWLFCKNLKKRAAFCPSREAQNTKICQRPLRGVPPSPFGRFSTQQEDTLAATFGSPRPRQRSRRGRGGCCWSTFALEPPSALQLSFIETSQGGHGPPGPLNKLPRVVSPPARAGGHSRLRRPLPTPLNGEPGWLPRKARKTLHPVVASRPPPTLPKGDALPRLARAGAPRW